jgi:hypothetical protein
MAATTDSTTYEKGKLYDINLNDLQADPDQPRKVIDAQALEDITASISKLGVLQPIIFRTAADGSKIVVAGERRVAAARNAGLTTIPAVFIADGNRNTKTIIARYSQHLSFPLRNVAGMTYWGVLQLASISDNKPWLVEWLLQEN